MINVESLIWSPPIKIKIVTNLNKYCRNYCWYSKLENQRKYVEFSTTKSKETVLQTICTALALVKVSSDIAIVNAESLACVAAPTSKCLFTHAGGTLRNVVTPLPLFDNTTNGKPHENYTWRARPDLRELPPASLLYCTAETRQYQQGSNRPLTLHINSNVCYFFRNSSRDAY